MKKKIITALLGVATVATLASCGGQKARPNFTCPEEFDTETPVTVKFWNTMGQNLQVYLNETIDEFKVYYPNITIESEYIGGYDDVRDQILMNMGVQQYPDVAYCYPDHVALYNEAQITVSLDDVMSNSKYGFGGSEVAFDTPSREDFVTAFLEEGAQFGDGLTYTVPFLRSTEALFYNKTFFEENHLTVPTTWDEMWDVCAAIKQIDPNACPLGYDSEGNLFITLAETYGYGYTSPNSFDFNNEGMRGLMKTFKEKYDLGYFTTQELNGGSYTNSLMTDLSAEVKAYMCIGSTAGATYQANSAGAFETGVAPIPHAPNKDLKVISQGPSLVLFKNENPQQVLAAWLWTQYLLNNQVQARFALATGYLPVTNSAANLPAYQEELAKANGYSTGIAAAAAKQALAQRENYFTSAVFVGSATARDEVGALFIQIMQLASNNDADIERIFQNAIDECYYQSGL